MAGSRYAELLKETTPKTAHVASATIETKEPAADASLDDLRALLLKWQTRFLELQNDIAGGAMVPLFNYEERMHSLLRNPVAIARNRMDASSWNAFVQELHAAFDRVKSEAVEQLAPISSPV